MRSRLKRILRGYPGDREYWEKRYRDGGTSGSGSYGRLAQYKAEVVNGLIQELAINSLIDLGCGDGNQVSLFDENIHYQGYDVSKTAIKLCRGRFAKRPGWSFNWYDGKSLGDDVPAVDASLSLDVLFHLTKETHYRRYLELLFSVANNYVIIYSSHQVHEDGYHVKDREILKDIQVLFTQWQCITSIENPFSWDPQKPKSTSRSQFFVFGKI